METHAKTVDGVAATGDEHHLVELFLATLLKLATQGRESEDVVLRFVTENTEAVGLVEVLRLVDFLEQLSVTLCIQIGTVFDEDGIGVGGFLNGSGAVVGTGNGCHGTPTEFLQMLRFDPWTPGLQILGGEIVAISDLYWLADFAGQSLALGYLGFVDTLF